MSAVWVWLMAQALPCAGQPVSAPASIPRLSAAPLVDGISDDAVWSEARLFDAFVQVTPTAGAAPTRRTELRLGHDGRHLFVALRAFEPRPEAIVAQQMRRDVEALFSDDHLLLVFDVEGRERNGFTLLVNANGTQLDGLIYDGGLMRRDWDALWHSEARIDGEGWSAELAIPLSALGVRGNAGGDAAPPWRFNAQRRIAADSERLRLFNANADKEVFSLGDAAPLTGARSDVDSLGLRLKPSLRLTRRSTFEDPGTRLEPGLELFHQSDAGLRTTLALNTDFGEAEADERIVNLTRFPLFVQEKREFFLQDAGRFSFGGLVESPLPYFSRRIGIDAAGRQHDLDAGLKLAGTLGGIEFGAFGARVGTGGAAGVPATSTALDHAQMGVLRAAGGIGSHGRLGVIATTGNPQGTAGSQLWGVDYQHRDTQLFGSRTVDAHLWAQQSENAGLGRGRALGASVDYSNEGPTGRASLQRIDAAFLPALGFLEEAGVTRSEGSLGWWHVTDSGGSLIPGIDWASRRTLDGRESSLTLNPEIEFENAAGDLVLPEIFFETDRVANGYELLPGVSVAPGSYRWHYLYLWAETSASRPLSLSTELRSGAFYDGRRHDQMLALTWSPNRHWTLRGSFGRNDVSLQSGRFIVRTASLRFDHVPSNRLSGSLLAQWDNVSRELGLVARVRWAWATGRELLLSIDHLRTSASRGIAPEAPFS